MVIAIVILAVALVVGYRVISNRIKDTELKTRKELIEQKIEVEKHKHDFDIALKHELKQFRKAIKQYVKGKTKKRTVDA